MNNSTVATSFADLGIEIPFGSDGETRVLCPQCSEHHRTNSKTLGVNASEGVFHCFRCGWKGRIGHEFRNVVPLEPKRKKLDTGRKARAIDAVLSSAMPLSDPRAKIGRHYLYERMGWPPWSCPSPFAL